MSILTCMDDSNFADEVCHTFVDMSTELWTHGLGNVECISCCLMLQITYLGVYKCILYPRVMFLHTPRMYFRLQPVFSINLCSVGFANVDVF